MRFNIRRSEISVSDLKEIWQFIAKDSSTQADTWIRHIETRISLIAENPLMGRLRPELGENVRSFTIEDYVILYRPESESDTGLFLFRILHGSRDVRSDLVG
jgi:toxin ParE1/3/4